MQTVSETWLQSSIFGLISVFLILVFDDPFNKAGNAVTFSDCLSIHLYPLTFEPLDL